MDLMDYKEAKKAGKQVSNWGNPSVNIDSMYGRITRKEWQEEEVKRFKKDGIKSFRVENDKGETAIFRTNKQ